MKQVKIGIGEIVRVDSDDPRDAKYNGLEGCVIGRDCVNDSWVYEIILYDDSDKVLTFNQKDLMKTQRKDNNIGPIYTKNEIVEIIQGVDFERRQYAGFEGYIVRNGFDKSIGWGALVHFPELNFDVLFKHEELDFKIQLYGKKKSSFQFNDKVIVKANDEELMHLNGLEGTIIGMSQSQDGKWYYAISFDDLDDAYSFNENDLNRIYECCFNYKLR